MNFLHSMYQDAIVENRLKTANFCHCVGLHAYKPRKIITKKREKATYSIDSNKKKLPNILRSLITSLIGPYSLKSIGNQKDFL